MKRIILSLLLLAFIASLIFWQLPKKQQFLNYRESTLKQISLNWNEHSLTLNQTSKDIWEIGQDFPVDNFAIGTFLQAIANLQAKKIIDSVPTLSSYGLAKPKLTLSLINKAKNIVPIKLLIGEVSPLKGSYYAMTNHNGPLYLIEATEVDQLFKTSSDFRKKNIFPYQPDQVTKIFLEVTKQNLLLEKLSSGTWVHQGITLNHEVEDMLLAFIYATLEKAVKDFPKDLSLYNLNHPIATLKIILAEKAILIKISKKDNQYYIFNEDLPTVFSMDESLFLELKSFLDKIKSKGEIDADL